jgi:protein gp37
MSQALCDGGGRAFEDIQCHKERLGIPFSRKKPQLMFVDSMGDLFHHKVPRWFLAKVFDEMERADWHTYQILTKRPARMRNFVNDRYHRCAPRHIWFGVSIGFQKYTSRIRPLLQTNAALRFLSFEPLCEPLTINLNGIDWVIVGGECAPTPRPMKEEWALALRDQCLRARVPFFFKQWGGRSHGGRLLEGREWSEYPPIIVH